MIVLDEQLLGRNIEKQIANWYQGAVCFIIDLQPNTVIKDDLIPRLLQKENQPTFITINEVDFWRKVKLNDKFCIVCFAMPDSRVREIPEQLRDLFQHSLFDSKQKRMGKMIRVAENGISFYSFDNLKIQKPD